MARCDSFGNCEGNGLGIVLGGLLTAGVTYLNLQCGIAVGSTLTTAAFAKYAISRNSTPSAEA